MYPKATAPLNWNVYDIANARANRWMKRYYDATARIAELETRIKDLENGR
jgi:hypothetical protein